MTTDELMTYNWVQYKGNYMRVEEISRPTQKVSLASSHLVCPNVDVNDVEPIPMKEFVLRQLGLRKEIIHGEDNSKQTYWIDPHVIGYYNMSVRERIHFSPIVFSPSGHGNSWLFLNCDEGRIESFCNHVHQYQNALRFFDMDDNSLILKKEE